MNEQSYVKSFEEESYVEEDFVLKKCMLLFIFFLLLIENHLFSCGQIIIFFEEFGVSVFFFFKALYLN